MKTRQLLKLAGLGMLTLALLPAPSHAQGRVKLVKVWELGEGLNRPESVVYDAERDVLYVSNIVGDASAKDGDGYITKVSADGMVSVQEWVPGLHAPKGLALSNGKLYAADIDELVEIDPETGKVTARYPAEGAQFLNDVAADAEGHIFVSDSRTGSVYRLADDKLHVWLKDERIAAPNGVWANADELIIAAGDKEAENPGGARYLQSISYDAKEIKPLKDRVPLGSIDAVVPDGKDGYFLSDWGAGKVFHYTSEKGATELVKLGQGTADLDYAADESMIFLPVMMSNQLIGYRVEWVE